MRLRLLLLIAGTEAAIIWWVADSEIIRSVYLICYSLMMPTVLFMLAARVLVRRGLLRRDEALLGYIALTAAVPIVGFGGLRFLMPAAGFLRYFAETQPQWRPWLSYLAGMPVLQNAGAVEALFRGGAAVPWDAWVRPIAFWSAYLLILAGAWTGLGISLDRLWVREERLTYPVTALPLRITDPSDDLTGRATFWVGVSAPVVLQSLLALREWYPAVPAIQLKAFDLAPLLALQKPWSAIPDLPIGLYPMAIGLAYLVPSHVSFSCWFFWLATRVSCVVAAALGIETGSSGAARFPYREEQSAGAWVAFAVLLVIGAAARWRAMPRNGDRLHVAAAVWAAMCLLACSSLIVLTGVPPVIALGIVGVYAAYVLTGARVRAEAGGQWTFAPATWTPARVVTALSGTDGLSDRAMLAVGHFDLVHVDIRAQSLPYFMEGLKVADTAGLGLRRVVGCVAAATVLAIALGWWSGLTSFHAVGAATVKSNAYALWKVRYGMQQMDSVAANATRFDRDGATAMAAGALITVGLAAIRARFFGFALHPVGYVLSNTYTMNAFFVPFLVAWLAKALIVRFGGVHVYRRSVGFFLGLIVGDITVQAAWTIIGRLLDAPVYQFLS